MDVELLFVAFLVAAFSVYWCVSACVYSVRRIYSSPSVPAYHRLCLVMLCFCDFGDWGSPYSVYSRVDRSCTL